MCGICGTFGFTNPLVNKDTLERMVSSIDHRGPDSKGTYIDENISMGHTRLSIIDLSAAGEQPMKSDDASVVIVYNGELYNYKNLRKKLLQIGRPFRSNTDTEVVLKSYIEWGPTIFSEFEGMFAFAIWDKRHKIFYLVRDRFGIKPIYFNQTDYGIVYGSEIKALLSSGLIENKVNNQSLNEFMWYGNSLGNKTLFNGINKLLPGHYLKIEAGKIEINEYWNINNINEINDDRRTVKNEVFNRLDNAVKNHLISDVPVGIFLSGGIDSTAITALASKHYNGILKTFTVGFDFNNGTSELSTASKIANLYKTDHQELNIKGAELPNILEKLIDHHDEPFSDAANIPLYLLTKELKGSIKVVLQGDGGDEIFGGYRRYNIFSNEIFWRFLSKIWMNFKGLYPKNIRFQRYNRFMYALSQSKSSLRMALMLTQDSPLNDPTKILNKDIQNSIYKINPFIEYEYWEKRFENFEPVKKMLFTDSKIQLPNTFLEKVDKPSMANSIEVRVPLLDNKLTEYVMGLPSINKVRYMNKKWILKEVLKDKIPSYVLNAKKKGFDVPFSSWLKEPMADYMRSVLLDNQSRISDLFDEKILEKKINNHISGKVNNGFILWKALNLAVWYNKFIKK